MGKYRLVVGETGNEIGHVMATTAQTEVGAKIALGRALAKYDGDGWGYWEVLRVSAAESQSGHNEWDRE